MIEKLKKPLLLIFVLILIFNFNCSIYGKEENIVVPSGLSKSELHDSIEAYVKEHNETTAGLAISVFNDKEDLYLDYHGYKDLENQLAVSENTVFEWGSTSKLLVWVSVFQLWEQDKIDLNEDIRTYLPKDFLKKANKDEKITMLNLMHHDAGWQEIILDMFVKDMKDVKNLKETLKKTEPKQVYPVGKYKAYSNWGTALAGYIVEEISRQDFAIYVHENIFNPLDMKDTAILPDLSDNLQVKEKRGEIKGYTSDNEIIVEDFMHIPLYPCGMATGTIKDLEKFGKALVNFNGQNNLFQKKETINSLLNPTLYYEGTEYPRNANGFWFQEFGVSVLGHGGNTKAFSANLLIDPISKVSVIVMTNQSNEEVYNFKMMPIIFGEFSPNKSALASGQEENLNGTYLISRTISKGYGKLYSYFSRIKIKAEDHRLLEFVFPGTSYYAYEFKPSLYDLEGALYQIYEDKDESTIISAAYGDSYRLKPSKIIIENIFIVLALLAILYSIIMFLVELIIFISSKIKKEKTLNTFLSKYHFFNLFSILALTLNIAIMAKKIFAFDILENIRPHIYLSIIFVFILISYSVFSFALKKTNIKRKTKVKYILTSIASLIIVFNLYYWEIFLIK